LYIDDFGKVVEEICEERDSPYDAHGHGCDAE